MRLRAHFCFLCIVLSACSGGASSGPIAPKQLPVETVKATVTVVVPSRTQSTGRNPRYVSPSTQSMIVSVSSQGSGGSASSTANCALNSQSGTNTCTTTVDAPVGADTFTVNLYDAPNGTGNILSSGSTTFTIVQGQLNLVALTFVGVPAAIKMSASPTFFQRGLKDTIQLTVTEVDADNNVIVGPPAAYPSPITLMNSDTTGSVTLSTTQVTAASQPPVTVSYTGSTSAPSAVTITATATGIPAAKIDSASIPILTGTFVYVTDSNDLFPRLQQFFAQNGVVQAPQRVGGGHDLDSAAVAPDGTFYTGKHVNAFARDLTFLRSFDPNTNPTSLATDGGGNVYVSTAANISVYPPGATDPTPPLRVMNVAATNQTVIFVDALGEVISLNSSTISVYPPKSSGAVTPTRTITPASGITFSGGVSADSANNIYVTGTLFTQNAILVYPPTAQGAASPSRIISGPTANVGTPLIAVDATGFIYVCCSAGLQSFAPTATGDARQVGAVSVDSGSHSIFTGVAVDPSAVTSAGPP